MSLTERLDTFQRRHPVAGFPIGVVYKFGEDQGPYLAALVTYYGFLSIFPLLLLLTSVLGFVLDGRPQLQQQILDSTLSQFPVIGDELSNPQGLQAASGRSSSAGSSRCTAPSVSPRRFRTRSTSRGRFHATIARTRFGHVSGVCA